MPSITCMCGTQQGYMHASDCPFPLFYCDADRAAAWLAGREALCARLAVNPEKGSYLDKLTATPGAALDRLLDLTAGLARDDYQVKTDQVKQEELDAAGYDLAQNEKAALYTWARARLRPDLFAHITRLCDGLTEAVALAQELAPGGKHNAGVWATAIREARAAIGAGRALEVAPTAGELDAIDWQPVIQTLGDRYGNDWPTEALERLLILTARYGYIGAWSNDPQEREEQRERLALHRWAREVIEAGIAFQQSAY